MGLTMRVVNPLLCDEPQEEESVRQPRLHCIFMDDDPDDSSQMSRSDIGGAGKSRDATPEGSDSEGDGDPAAELPKDSAPKETSKPSADPVADAEGRGPSAVESGSAAKAAKPSASKPSASKP